MKLILPRALRRTLLAAICPLATLSPALSAATVSSSGGILTVTGTGTADLPAWSSSDNGIVFDDTTDGTVVSYSGLLQNMSSFTVNSDGATLQNSPTNTSWGAIVAAATLDMEINGDFTLKTVGGATSDQFYRNFALSANTVNIDIASTKTFNYIGDIAADPGAALNLTGGGTFTYTRDDVADGSNNQHDGNVAISISEGTTMNIAGNDASSMNILLFEGTITLDQGNLTLMTGDVILHNALSLTGASTISGATDLTFDNTLNLNGGGSLNLGAMNVDFSSLTLDGAGLSVGSGFSFTGTGITGLTDGASANIAGLENTETATWSQSGDTWTLNIAGYTPRDLIWAGGDGNLAVGTGGWTVGGASASFANNDHITIAGANGTITVEGDITVSSITVTGDGNYTLVTAGPTHDSLSNAGGLIKNGAGILALDGTLGLTGNKQINEGMLFIVSADALGEGELSFAGGTTLTVANSLGDVTVAGGNYVRRTPYFNVVVLTGTTFTENVNLQLGAGATKISGGGTYQIQKLLLNQPNTSSPSTLNIESGTTLVIQSDALNTSGGAGAFMVGHYSGVTNTINIDGTLTSAAGISTNAGTGIINVNHGGTLNLQKGLAVAAVNTAPTINVESGGTLTLWEKGTGGSAGKNLTVNIKSGASLAAGGTAAVTVSDSLNYAENANVVFDGGAAGLILDHEVDLGTGGATLRGNVTFNADSSMRSILSENALLVGRDATLSVGTSITLADWAITAHDAVAPITIQAQNGANATFNSTQAINAVITNAKLSKSVRIENTTLKDSSVAAGTTLTLIGNVTLDNTQFAAGSGVTAMSLTSLTVKDADAATLTTLSTLDTSAVDLTLSGSIDVSHTPAPSASATLTSIDTLESTSVEMYLYTLDLAPGIYQSITLDGTESLTLTLNMTQEGLGIFRDQYTSKGVAFAFAEDIALAGSYSNMEIAIYVGGSEQWRETVRGVGNVTGDTGVVLYIPEPSTATLSLLALTGLLARRRRKA